MEKVRLNIFNDDFKIAINNVKKIEVQGIEINLLSMSDLVATKKASGRYKDLDDLDNLDYD
ncbi:hypothetical protein [Mongoliitalea daihaiensis]|uniref:hypothetical protein n=1 Tax=Mongoliitalea daihaiensis TaxID=2782006 RepID=UPI001F258EE0|nr:hypothetical protein [Mongoliitalea daihaiensis]UJP63647.1 hypothetical protein IPZ59_12465 [Mongoliitalea daihaiensis]